MSTSVFVDPEISTQADEAQSSRVPVPLPEDSYEAIRHAYLVVMNTKSEPFEDPVETKTPESPHTVASPTSLPDSTPPVYHAEESEDSDTSGSRSTSSDSTAPLSQDHPLTHTSPTLVLLLRRTARMAVRVPPAISPGRSARIVEVAAMSDSVFRKRFRSSYESSPSSSPPDHSSRKRSRDTFELVEDEEEEDEEVEKSPYSDSESEDAEDEGPTIEDEGPAAGDEGLAAGDEAPGIRVKSPGLGGDEAVPKLALREGQICSIFEVGQGSRSVPEPERPERVSTFRQPMLTTWIDLEDGRTYIDVLAYPPPAPPVQTPPSPEWSSGSLPISPAPSVVPLPISSPMISLTVPSPVASPVTAKAERFLAELGAQVEMQGGLIHDLTIRLGELSLALVGRNDRDIVELFTRSGVVRDEIFSQRYQLRSLKHEQERTAVMFGALWRPVLALESWAGHVDTRMADMSRAWYDDHRLVHDMLVQQAALQRELQEMRGRVTALE
ncbi:hypothetical protein Tco_0559724 [Tanacetum coccineum]